MFAFGPIVASPTYDRCGTLAPSPSSAFLVSTNPPTFALRPSFVPGRRYENGPTVALGPTSAPIACVRSTSAPSPTTVSTSVVSGPTTAPEATDVVPASWVFRSITASGDSVTVTSTQVVAGSSIDTPDRIQAVFTRSRSSARSPANSARSLQPSVSSESGATNTATAWPTAGSSVNTSVRYSSPWSLSVDSLPSASRSR